MLAAAASSPVVPRPSHALKGFQKHTADSAPVAADESSAVDSSAADVSMAPHDLSVREGSLSPNPSTASATDSQPTTVDGIAEAVLLEASDNIAASADTAGDSAGAVAVAVETLPQGDAAPTTDAAAAPLTEEEIRAAKRARRKAHKAAKLAAASSQPASGAAASSVNTNHEEQAAANTPAVDPSLLVLSQLLSAFPDHHEAYGEVAFKRLRTLRKRLAKIEKAEEDFKIDPKKLEKDQIEAMSKKPEVVILIKELEELHKGLISASADELKLRDAFKAQFLVAEEQAVLQSRESAKVTADVTLKRSLRLLSVLTEISRNSSPVLVAFQEATAEWQEPVVHLRAFNAYLTEPFSESLSCLDGLQDKFANVMADSESTVPGLDFTYRHVHSLLESVEKAFVDKLTPKPEPVFEEPQPLAESGEEKATTEAFEAQDSAVVEAVVTVPLSPGGSQQVAPRVLSVDDIELNGRRSSNDDPVAPSVAAVFALAASRSSLQLNLLADTTPSVGTTTDVAAVTLQPAAAAAAAAASTAEVENAAENADADEAAEIEAEGEGVHAISNGDSNDHDSNDKGEKKNRRRRSGKRVGRSRHGNSHEDAATAVDGTTADAAVAEGAAVSRNVAGGADDEKAATAPSSSSRPASAPKRPRQPRSGDRNRAESSANANVNTSGEVAALKHPIHASASHETPALHATAVNGSAASHQQEKPSSASSTARRNSARSSSKGYSREDHLRDLQLEHQKLQQQPEQQQQQQQQQHQQQQPSQPAANQVNGHVSQPKLNAPRTKPAANRAKPLANSVVSGPAPQAVENSR